MGVGGQHHALAPLPQALFAQDRWALEPVQAVL